MHSPDDGAHTFRLNRHIDCFLLCARKKPFPGKIYLTSTFVASLFASEHIRKRRFLMETICAFPLPSASAASDYFPFRTGRTAVLTFYAGNRCVLHRGALALKLRCQLFQSLKFLLFFQLLLNFFAISSFADHSTANRTSG